MRWIVPAPEILRQVAHDVSAEAPAQRDTDVMQVQMHEPKIICVQHLDGSFAEAWYFGIAMLYLVASSLAYITTWPTKKHPQS